jgi:hypothetical protein
MRRKHFEKIAKSLNKTVTRMRNEGDVEGLNTVADLIYDLTEMFKEDNPLFKPKVFIAAACDGTPPLKLRRFEVE